MKLSNLIACGLLLVVSQGCDDDKDSETRGGIGYEDAALRDASDRGDASTVEPKDAGEADAANGAAGASGAAGGHAGAGGNAAGSGGTGGRGVTGEAGVKAAGSGGKAGGAGKGGAAGSAGAAGAKAPAAGSGGMSTPAAGAGGSSSGVAGTTAGAGGAAGTTAQAGTGGAAGNAEAGSGAAAGSGGDGGVSSGDRCGTRGGVTCEDGQFCNFEPDRDCGGTDRGGLCEDKPEICNDLYQPVCGCDNRTHANVCYTHRDGASVKHEGLCTIEECDAAGGHPMRSDGSNTPSCSQGEQSWSIASGGDEPAVCCLSDQPSGRTCAGIAGLGCEEREFCNFETDAGGQGCDGRVADAAGMCQALPVGCTREYNPVCGCDKKSYDNACVAHSFGASIFHTGACNELDCAAVAGRVVYGSGPAPMCAPGEVEWTDNIVNSSGSMAIEGAICCRSE